MRSIEEIYAGMLETMEARCGFRPEESCDLTVRLYAAAAQIQALEIQTDWVLDQGFPQTAQGVYLDRHAAMRGLKRTAAVKSAGTLRFFVEAASAVDLTVPAGTVCMTEEEQRFLTTAQGLLPAGELFVDVPAEAVESGGASNAARGTITILTACPVGITRCTNPEPFAGGADAEGDDSLRQRVLESYQRLPNGANAAWYERAAMEHDGVAAAKAVGRARGIGTVDIYIAAEGGAPSAELLAQVQADIQEKREIAVDAKVLAPTAKPVDVTIQVTAKQGFDEAAVRQDVEQALAAFFSGHLLGKPVRTAELTSLAFRREGVENVRLTAPAADIAAEQGALPVLGTLTVTKWEA